MTTRKQFVEIAEKWIGVPYKHEGKSKSEGVDCINLVIELWREADPKTAVAYQEKWAFIKTPEDFLREASPYLIQIDFSERRIGDILIFKPSRRGKAVHCGIIIGKKDLIIHSYEGRGVGVDHMPEYYHKRCLLSFRYPWITGFDP